MGDPTSTRATLRNKFELEKHHRSYVEFRSKTINTPPDTKPSSSNKTQNQKTIETEEIIKYKKHLPSYLERGRPIHDRALTFGVMDWGRLEKWQYQNNKPSPVISTKYSPSSSITSSVFSMDGSSPHSSSVVSSSPARQKVHRVTLRSHFKASPNVKLSFSKITNENSRMELDSSSDHSNLLKSSVIKQRSISPLRRFSFTKKDESPMDNSRAHSSPLRRLLNPILPSKTRQVSETGHQDSKTKTKNKLGFKKVIRGESLSRKQALFQTAVKNGRLLFTFAVENNDILAATVTGLSSFEKDDVSNRVYTFFTVKEVKKKNVSWLPQSGKSKEPGYVPNVMAQMKVSNPLNSNFNIWEFVLFLVDSNVKMPDELEAVVVEFDRDGFGVTVVLPGGNHGAPSKGGPAPLLDRWRSGGVCDCGGWDMGCRLRVLSSRLQSNGSRPAKVRVNAGQFELFFQGEVMNEKKPFFSLSPLKEGIFSVEYNSSLSILQAFSICISVVECRKEPRTPFCT